VLSDKCASGLAGKRETVREKDRRTEGEEERRRGGEEGADELHE